MVNAKLEGGENDEMSLKDQSHTISFMAVIYKVYQ